MATETGDRDLVKYRYQPELLLFPSKSNSGSVSILMKKTEKIQTEKVDLAAEEVDDAARCACLTIFATLAGLVLILVIIAEIYQFK